MSWIEPYLQNSQRGQVEAFTVTVTSVSSPGGASDTQTLTVSAHNYDDCATVDYSTGVCRVLDERPYKTDAPNGKQKTSYYIDFNLQLADWSSVLTAAGDYEITVRAEANNARGPEITTTITCYA